MGKISCVSHETYKKCILYRSRFTMLRKKIVEVYKKEALDSASAELNMEINARLVRMN
jgi:hypothetical protein